MIGKSKEFEDVSRVASSFPTYLEKMEATLLAGYGRVVRWLVFGDISTNLCDLDFE